MSHQKKYQQLAKDILSLCGGSENISSHTHCMTRLRITPMDNEKVHVTAIKELDGVIGVVEAETLQIILGTGVVNQVSSAFEELLNASGSYDLNNEAQKQASHFTKEPHTIQAVLTADCQHFHSNYSGTSCLRSDYRDNKSNRASRLA